MKSDIIHSHATSNKRRLQKEYFGVFSFFLLKEFYHYFVARKKWWLLPTIALLLLIPFVAAEPFVLQDQPVTLTSSGSTTAYQGMVLSLNESEVLYNATVTSGVTATKAYIFEGISNDPGDLLVETDIISGTATFNYLLDANINYSLAVNSEGASYTRYFLSQGGFPDEVGYLTWEAGQGGTTAAWYIWDYVYLDQNVSVDNVSVSLNSPDNAESFYTNTTSVDLNYTVYGIYDAYNCTVYVDGSSTNVSTGLANDSTVVYPHSVASSTEYNWSVSCSNGGENDTSVVRTFDTSFPVPVPGSFEDDFDRSDATGTGMNLGRASNGFNWTYEDTATESWNIEDDALSYIFSQAGAGGKVNLRLSEPNTSRLDFQINVSSIDNSGVIYIKLEGEPCVHTGAASTCRNIELLFWNESGTVNFKYRAPGGVTAFDTPTNVSMGTMYNISLRNISYSSYTYEVYVDGTQVEDNAAFYRDGGLEYFGLSTVNPLNFKMDSLCSDENGDCVTVQNFSVSSSAPEGTISTGTPTWTYDVQYAANDTVYCSVYVDDVLNETFASVNDSSNSFNSSYDFAMDDYSWYASCDDGVEVVNSTERNFTVLYSLMSLSLVEPANNSLINTTSFSFNATTNTSVNYCTLSEGVTEDDFNFTFSGITDTHHCESAVSGCVDAETPISNFLSQAATDNASFIVCTGDCWHNRGTIDQLIEDAGNFTFYFNSSDIPAYMTIGNHDSQVEGMNETFLEEIAETLIDENHYYYKDYSNIRFVFFDAAYNSTGGMPSGTENGGGSAVSNFIDGVQLAWLNETLRTASEAGMYTVMFSHFRFDHGVYGMANNSEVNALLYAYNDSVIASFQGHHHTEAYSFTNGIHYVTAQDNKANPTSFYSVTINKTHLTVEGYGGVTDRSLAISSTTQDNFRSGSTYNLTVVNDSSSTYAYTNVTNLTDGDYDYSLSCYDGIETQMLEFNVTVNTTVPTTGYNVSLSSYSLENISYDVHTSEDADVVLNVQVNVTNNGTETLSGGTSFVVDLNTSIGSQYSLSYSQGAFTSTFLSGYDNLTSVDGVGINTSSQTFTIPINITSSPDNSSAYTLRGTKLSGSTYLPAYVASINGVDMPGTVGLYFDGELTVWDTGSSYEMPFVSGTNNITFFCNLRIGIGGGSTETCGLDEVNLSGAALTNVTIDSINGSEMTLNYTGSLASGNSTVFNLSFSTNGSLIITESVSSTSTTYNKNITLNNSLSSTHSVNLPSGQVFFRASVDSNLETTGDTQVQKYNSSLGGWSDAGVVEYFIQNSSGLWVGFYQPDILGAETYRINGQLTSSGGGGSSGGSGGSGSFDAGDINFSDIGDSSEVCNISVSDDSVVFFRNGIQKITVFNGGSNSYAPQLSFSGSIKSYLSVTNAVDVLPGKATEFGIKYEADNFTSGEAVLSLNDIQCGYLDIEVAAEYLSSPVDIVELLFSKNTLGELLSEPAFGEDQAGLRAKTGVFTFGVVYLLSILIMLLVLYAPIKRTLQLNKYGQTVMWFLFLFLIAAVLAVLLISLLRVI